MKKLKPSHREKKRYLLIKGKDANKDKIEKVILKYIGVLGFAKSCPEVVKKISGGLVLAINRKELDKIRAGFAISGKDLKIIRVSGNIGSLKP